jgi:hypothetical protein
MRRGRFLLMFIEFSAIKDNNEEKIYILEGVNKEDLLTKFEKKIEFLSKDNEIFSIKLNSSNALKIKNEKNPELNKIIKKFSSTSK